MSLLKGVIDKAKNAAQSGKDLVVTAAETGKDLVVIAAETGKDIVASAAETGKDAMEKVLESELATKVAASTETQLVAAAEFALHNFDRLDELGDGVIGLDDLTLFLIRVKDIPQKLFVMTLSFAIKKLGVKTPTFESGYCLTRNSLQTYIDSKKAPDTREH